MSELSEAADRQGIAESRTTKLYNALMAAQATGIAELIDPAQRLYDEAAAEEDAARTAHREAFDRALAANAEREASAKRSGRGQG